jgi:hypothetical protein
MSLGGVALAALIAGSQFLVTRPRTRNGRPRGGGRTQAG